MIWWNYKQYLYAEKNWKRWKEEYEEYQENKDTRRYWPYNKKIEYLGVAHRELKVWGPILAAFLFIISLFFG